MYVMLYRIDKMYYIIYKMSIVLEFYSIDITVQRIYVVYIYNGLQHSKAEEYLL